MNTLTAEDHTIVEEELAFALRAREAIERAASGRDRTRSLDERIQSLQSEAANARAGDLPAVLAQLHVLKQQAARRSRQRLPSTAVPYFAHMRLLVEGGTRDVLLGFQTFIDSAAGVTIVDWRTAPIARIFFNYAVGDVYEHEVDGRWLSGEVESRRVLTFGEGEVAVILDHEGELRRDERGAWTREDPVEQPRLAGGAGRAGVARFIGTGEAGRKIPVVTALLDAEQYEALHRDPQSPLLLLGGAGCGKTTVAMHRLASLAFRDGGGFRARDMAVIVPERGLVKLTRAILREIGMQSVAVSTFDDWIESLGKRLLKGLPRTICPATPFKVSRFKRHPAVRAVLRDLLEELADEMARELDGELRTGGLVHGVFTSPDARGITLRARMNRAERRLTRRVSSARAKEVRAVLRRYRRRIGRVVTDRRRFLLDRALLRRAVDRSDGDLDASMVEAVIVHTAAQLASSTEQEYGSTDPERLQALDARSIDEGTPAEVAGTIDVEDYALLFDLHRLKTGSLNTDKSRFPAYSHLVVDEAQDLAAVELAVLGGALREGASVTVAGDQAQQIDPSVVFAGWRAVLQALEVEWSQPIELQTSYRCPRPIAGYAHRVLGDLAPPTRPESPRDGAPVLERHFPNEGHAAIFLTEALQALAQREPQANLAVIARTPESARRVHEALSQTMRVRLVLDGEFEFAPGIDITDVGQVKGLEFDYVVIPDASTTHYPTEDEARRGLHVAVTRAVYQLCVVSSGKPSALLPTGEAPMGPSSRHAPEPRSD